MDVRVVGGAWPCSVRSSEEQGGDGAAPGGRSGCSSETPERRSLAVVLTVAGDSGKGAGLTGDGCARVSEPPKEGLDFVSSAVSWAFTMLVLPAALEGRDPRPRG